MRVLIAHNRYQQPGAEDQVFGPRKTDLLAARGHEVVRYELHNDSIKSTGRLEARPEHDMELPSSGSGSTSCAHEQD